MGRTLKALLLFFLMCNSGRAQDYISGQVVDSKTKEPLSFATIAFKGTGNGTVSNKEGYYILQIPTVFKDSSIVFSYMGYKSSSFQVAELRELKEILLVSEVIQLEDVVIRPLSPEEYIRRAVNKMKDNAPSDPFGTRAYYREMLSENGEYVNLVEGYFKSFYPSYQDTTANHHQLLLYRQADNLKDFEFMAGFMEKQEEKSLKKEKKQAKKKGYDLDTMTFDMEGFDITEEIRNGFGGPETTISMDLMKYPEPCLDLKRIKHFKYWFGDPIVYQGRKLITIFFKTKGKEDHMKQQGKIFIDLETDGIASLEYSGIFYVPAIAKPVMWAFGLTLPNPRFKKKVRYQFVDGKWYPDYFYWWAHFYAEYRHWFSEDDKSRIKAEQVFKVNRVLLQDAVDIEKEKRFDADEPMDKQVHNDESLNWKKVNTIPIEKR